MSNSNNVPCCSHCPYGGNRNAISRHMQVQLQLVEHLANQLRKTQNENARLRKKLKTQGKDDDMHTEEDEDWSYNNAMNEIEAEVDLPVRTIFKKKEARKKCLKSKAASAAATPDVVSATDCVESSSKIACEEIIATKNMIDNECASKLYTASRIKWGVDTDNVEEDKQLCYSFDYHKQFMTCDDAVLDNDIPPPQVTKKPSYLLPYWCEKNIKPKRADRKGMSEEQLKAVELECANLNKGHAKREFDEQKRKRWDGQRIREERYVEKLKLNQTKNKRSDCISSFLPSSYDAVEISVNDFLPIEAFGCPLPKYRMVEYSCDRITLQEEPTQA